MGQPGQPGRPPEGELLGIRLRYLVSARMAFAAFLLAAAAAVEFGWGGGGSGRLAPLYCLTGAVFLLCVLYLTLGGRLAARPLAYAQVLADVVLVSALVYLTGGMESIFSFLYFPVIIAASALLYRPGGMLAASASAILFGLLVDLHYWGLLCPIPTVYVPAPADLLTKVLMHTAAFFLVARLSAHLAEEARSSASRLSDKEREVARLEEFNRYVVESMTSGLITVDVAGRLTSLNRAAEVILGVAAAEVLGLPVAGLLPEVAARLEETGGGAEEALGAARSDAVFRRADGAELHLGFSVSPLRDGRGEMIGHVLIFRDLTGLRQMEERLRQLDRLAAVGQLAAGLAHEIRNPLASISGGVQLLRSDPKAVSAENRRLLDIVVREAARLNGLINDFLLFARPGTRPRERLDLTAVVAEALEAAERGRAGGAPVSVERRLAEGLWVEASPEEMRQVVSNLVTNALEAMPEGGALRVAAEREGEEVVLSVSDTGCGVSREDLGRIFLPFFTRKERGTGLGLAIVHAIVERHGGRLEVESRPGATTFRVRLPRAEGAAEPRLAA